MTAPTARTSPLLVATLVAAIAGLGVAAVGTLRADAAMRRLADQQAANEAVLQQVLGEVTRFRLEQSTGTKGPQALLEKLRTYAPLAADARTAEPDYKNAKKEMDAILRAFASLGADALPAIHARLDELKTAKGYDEMAQLLRAVVAIDKAAGSELLKQVLLGMKLPSPRLRWFAARELLQHDRPLAQLCLRQILLTESSQGVNPDRAAAFDASVPDAAAFATTGFHNFVSYYVESDDPKLDDTLLMVLGRVEHDAVTIQECLKALGARRCARAVEAIEKVYQKPPLGRDNPLFQKICLDALFEIRHADAKPFLEAALATASTELIAKHIQELLTRIANGDFPPPPPPKK